jgi:hypothetical protein
VIFFIDDAGHWFNDEKTVWKLLKLCCFYILWISLKIAIKIASSFILGDCVKLWWAATTEFEMSDKLKSTPRAAILGATGVYVAGYLIVAVLEIVKQWGWFWP